MNKLLTGFSFPSHPKIHIQIQKKQYLYKTNTAKKIYNFYQKPRKYNGY